MVNQHKYRPIWTCGRYNREHHAAIFYNLLAGYSFYYEDESADVIGEILKAGKNGILNIDDISKATLIDTESILSFFEELKKYGLVTDECPTSDDIKQYRKQLSEFKCNTTQVSVKTTQEKLPFASSNAEMQYTEKVGGITNAMLELTYNCSEKCIHCYNPGATRNDDEISHRGDRVELQLDDYKRIIDELYEQGATKICLTGGDPFSKSIAWDIIDYLYKKEIGIVVFTNGQRIVDKTSKLADYFPLLVGVSIYSGKAEDHDYITRIKGSWDKSMKVVKELSELAVPLNLKCCVMRPNVKSYYMVADIAKKYGAEPQFEISITDSLDGDTCASRNLRLTPDLLEYVLRDDNIPLYVGKEAPNFGGQKRDANQAVCGGGYNSMCISPDGVVHPCAAFPFPFGNLKDSSLKDILENPDLSKWKNTKLKDYDECGKYDYCDYCNLCSGANYSEHHDYLKAAENNCYMAKVRYNLAMRMMNGYDPLHQKSLAECLSELEVSLQPLKRDFNKNR